MPTTQNLRRDPDYDEKLAELNRFCNDPSRKPGKVQRDIRKTVRFLGENSLVNNDYWASAKDIWTQLPQLPSSEGFGREDGIWVKTHINSAREALNNFYKRPESTNSRFRIRIPYYTEFLDRVVGRPYRVSFETPKPAESSPQLMPHDPTIELWQKMVHGIDNTDRIFLIYDTPDVQSSNPTINTPDSWSGSGEVAAACMIGQCVSHLRPHLPIDIRRWRDMSFMELDVPGRCLIVLGSSLQNTYMQRLRERERWKPRQTFHFEPPTGKEKYGHICKGGVVGRPSTRGKKFGWEAKPSGSAKEHALVTFFRDADNHQTLVALQGITTVGTLAAARYICNGERIAELTKAFDKQSVDIRQSLPSFELLLEVCVEESSSMGDTTFCELKVYKDQPSR